MADAKGPTTAGTDFELLETLGRPVLDAQPKLAALIRAQLSETDAAFFATPERDGSGRVIGWRAANGRPLRAGATLPAAAARALEARAAAVAARIEGVARGLETQGDAGRVAAHSLRSALVTPDGVDALHADGDLPVLAFWGMARPGQARPVLDLGWAADGAAAAGAAVAAVAAATDPTGGTGPAPHAAPALAGDVPPLTEEVRRAVTPGADGRPAAAARRAGLPLFAWALPAALLLLLLWLLVLAATPLAPIIVEVVEAAPPAADPAEGPAARVAELQAALRDAEAAEGRLAAACEPLPPEPPPPIREVEAPPPPPPLSVERAEAPPPPPESKIAALPSVKPTPPSPSPPPPRVQPAPPKVAPPAVAPPPPPPPPPTLQVCTPTWPPGRSPRVIFVLDGSGSMRDSIPGASSRMVAAKQSIGAVVQALHKDIRTSLVSFSDCGATSRSPFYDASQRPTLLGQVNAVTPQQATSLAASIARAGAAAPSRAPATLVVVSDGGDTCGGDPCAAARQVKAAKPDVTINVIDLSGGQSGGVLQCVARAGGGQVLTPSNAGQMSTQLQQATGQPDASGCH